MTPAAPRRQPAKKAAPGRARARKKAAEPKAAEPTPEPEQPVEPNEVIPPGGSAAASQEQPEADPNEVLADAVDTALAMPGVPGRDEFLTLAQTARMLSMSPLVPKFLRNNPAACFHLAMIGRDLGISPTAATTLIDVIPETKNDPSKGGQASLSPELLNAQIDRLGLGKIVPLFRSDSRAVAVALAPGGSLDVRCTKRGEHWEGPTDEPCLCVGVLGQTEFTWEDARMAGLVGDGCQPGDHKIKTHSRQDGSKWTSCDCRQGYKTFPKRMMWWRASGFAASDFMPEAGLGLYSPEELGATVDDHGRMIDPATVGLPEGFDAPPPAARGGSKKAAPPPADEPAPEPEQRLAHQELHALPAETTAKVVEQLVAREFPRAREWTPRHIAFVRACIRPMVAKAVKAGYDYEAALAALQAAQAAPAAAAPAEAPEPAQAALAAGTPPEAAEGPETPVTAEPGATDDPTSGPEPEPEAAPAGKVPGGNLMHEVLERLRGCPDDVLNEALAATQRLPEAECNAKLAERTLPKTGNLSTRRLRLFEAVCTEGWAVERKVADATAAAEQEGAGQ